MLLDGRIALQSWSPFFGRLQQGNIIWCWLKLRNLPKAPRGLHRDRILLRLQTTSCRIVRTKYSIEQSQLLRSTAVKSGISVAIVAHNCPFAYNEPLRCTKVVFTGAAMFLQEPTRDKHQSIQLIKLCHRILRLFFGQRRSQINKCEKI